MKKIRFALIAIALVAIFHFVPFFDSTEAWVMRGFLGVGYGFRNAALSVGGFVGELGQIGHLEKENAALKEQVIKLNEKVTAAGALVAENESLKGLLAFKERTDLTLIPAEVIGADPDATVRALIINRGTEAGIVAGDPVIVGDGTLVGKIKRVAPGRSTILLPTDPRSAIAVMISDHPEADGVAQGEKGLVVSMTLIPQHAPVAAGNTVITTGREDRLPRGLILGTIESVTIVPSDPFMSATIVPAVDPVAITKVAVIHQK